MSRIHPECLHSDPSDRSVATDVLVREEPDEEDDEEEDEGDGKDDDEDDEEEDGYSEMSQRRRLRSGVELPVPAEGSPLDLLFT